MLHGFIRRASAISGVHRRRNLHPRLKPGGKKEKKRRATLDGSPATIKRVTYHRCGDTHRRIPERVLELPFANAHPDAALTRRQRPAARDLPSGRVKGEEGERAQDRDSTSGRLDRPLNSGTKRHCRTEVDWTACVSDLFPENVLPPFSPRPPLLFPLDLHARLPRSASLSSVDPEREL